MAFKDFLGMSEKVITFGGYSSKEPRRNGKGEFVREVKFMKLFTLIWRSIKIFIRYGNLDVHYHICGSIGKDAWDIPMEAENVEVRHCPLGPKATIW
jgi:hypothetical protein